MTCLPEVVASTHPTRRSRALGREEEDLNDAQIGKAVLDHTVRLRPRTEFPLTGGWVQRVSRRLGMPVGMHRAYRIIRLLRERGMIEDAGSYPHKRRGLPTGFKVPLFRLRQVTCSVGGQARQARWWEHPLFGFGTRSYPKEMPKWLKKWKPRREEAWSGERD